MPPLKFTLMVAVLIIVGADYDHNDLIPLINAINDVVLVQKSKTCVILVLDDRIQLVSSEDKSIHELTKCGNISNKNLEIIGEAFEYLNPLDVLDKLEKIASTRSSFLVYFTAEFKQHSGPKHPPNTISEILELAKEDIGDTFSLEEIVGISNQHSGAHLQEPNYPPTDISEILELAKEDIGDSVSLEETIVEISLP